MILAIVTTFTYVLLSVIAIFLTSHRKTYAWKIKFYIFIIFSILYFVFIIIEKSYSIKKEEELQRQLINKSEEIISKQEEKINELEQFSLTSLDFLHPTFYREYPNFRLGLMWYCLRSIKASDFHFRQDLILHPRNYASIYNRGILLAIDSNFNESLSLFKSIPTMNLSENKRELINLWIITLTNYSTNHKFVVPDSTQWDLWRFPLR
ncbi:MAG: hypothetical protein JXA06_12245 [Bacteroidetes bacterium]|nr:hypothetical protein [Bacteroidota bacterium]